MSLASSVSGPVSVALAGLFAILILTIVLSFWSWRITTLKADKITFVAAYGNDVVTFDRLQTAIDDAKLHGYHSLAAWGNEPEHMVRVYLVSEAYTGHSNLNPSEYFS